MADRYYLNGSDWLFKDFVGEDWVWRNAEKRGTRDVRFWRQGSVPSSVVYDLWKAGEIPDPYYEKNSLAIEWVPERTWIYKKSFRAPRKMEGQRIRLTMLGIDYEARIYLNDVLLGTHAGMYTPIRYDVTDLLDFEEENLLAVVILKAPEEQPQVGRTPLVRTHKCRMTYWWDFCPRMVHQGIWDDVYLEADGGAAVSDIWVRTEYRPDQTAEIAAQITIDTSKKLARPLDYQPGMLTSSPAAVESLARRCKVRIHAAVRDLYTEEVVCEKRYFCTVYEGDTVSSAVFGLSNPRLWFPNGSGAQEMYRMEVSLYGEDGALLHSADVRFGIRQLNFVPNETPDSTARGYTLEVNGRKLYMKGWNWVPMDVLYGVKRPGKLRRLLTLAKKAGVNILRVWGGGLIEREEFYDLCDEYGILIWQEFIQSSSGIDNRPPEDPACLDFMRGEAEKIIPLKRNHPALALWCGGNELQSAGGRIIQDNEPMIRMLRRVVRELDPDRYFLPSSPSGRIFNNDLRFIEADPDGLHDVHGPWEHQGLTAQYTLYNQGTSLLASEFGTEGMTNYNTLVKSMDASHLWPPSRDNYLYFHRGSWWVNYPLVQECFGGELTEIKSAIRASQFLQYEGLRYAVESCRRRAFRSSGTLPWQFNEPYPNNYCTCSVDYYAQPKPAYYGVRRAYEPCHVSAKFAMQAWGGEDRAETEIFCQHSEGLPAGVTVIYRYIGASGTAYAQGEKRLGQLPEEKAVLAGRLECPLDRIADEIFFLDIRAVSSCGEALSDERYLFSTGTNLTPLLHQKKAALNVEAKRAESGRELILTNAGDTAAFCVWIEDAEEPGEEEGLYFDRNYITLLPGEGIRVRIETKRTASFPVRLSGFNVEEQVIRI